MIEIKDQDINFDFQVRIEITNLQTKQKAENLLMASHTQYTHVFNKLLPHMANELLQQLQYLIENK